MNKQEAIEKIKKLKGLTIKEKNLILDIEMISKGDVLEIIEQIDEPEKPVVPQYVADWYEENKDYFERKIFGLCLKFSTYRLDNPKLRAWFQNARNKGIQTLVNMHQFGYEIEKEKLYTVELPNPNAGGHVVLCKTGDGRVSITFVNAGRWRGVKNVQLTEAEIKQDFEWAWQFAKEVEE